MTTTATDHFVALSECHFMNEQSMHEISYYPGFTRWWQSVDGVIRAWAQPRSRGRCGDAAAARARAHRVDGQGGCRRLLRAPRIDDGRRRLCHLHVDQRVHLGGDRAVPRSHVPRVQRRADHAPRGEERDLGARVSREGARREALQGLRARGRSAQRQAAVAVLREGLRARRRAHDPHGHGATSARSPPSTRCRSCSTTCVSTSPSSRSSPTTWAGPITRR